VGVFAGPGSSTSEVAEKVPLVVIPNEVRNLSVLETQGKRDFSARSAPRFTENVLRERNDNANRFATKATAGEVAQAGLHLSAVQSSCHHLESNEKPRP
jgi:hypothetical protein